jgi:hypothetical protein
MDTNETKEGTNRRNFLLAYKPSRLHFLHLQVKQDLIPKCMAILKKCLKRLAVSTG